MSKTAEEISSEILIAAMSSGLIKTNDMGTSGQASDVATAYKTIFQAVAHPPPAPDAGQNLTSKKK
jgi:hypothetical protein